MCSSEVRIGHTLNETERQHVADRAWTVLQCLQQLGISCSVTNFDWSIKLTSFFPKRCDVRFSYNFCDYIDEHKLSDQRSKYTTTDPYPIYTVIDKKSKHDGLHADCWFEITPDESGYSLTGAFVDSSCWGSQFENGQKIKDQAEIDMLFLQGNTPQMYYSISIQMVTHWIWGTTYNYVYKMEVPSIHPSILSSEKRAFVDAGLLNNSPYFSVLRQERDIDLIISLDFSEGDPFQTVVDTAKTCTELHIPFPHCVVPTGENTEPNDFYVFAGSTDTPTVIHIPLFNCINCPGEVEKWHKIYTTFQMEYTESMISDLLNKAGSNISNNKENLLREIKYIMEKKKAKLG
uniref:PLA2c domain-containing protein n=1 Tax=Astyanax mexicanus TaxID=7994 RepID=A0A8B9KFP3_ASTMX